MGLRIRTIVLHRLLMEDEVILVKRAAFDGYDIDLYSKQNPYIDFSIPYSLYCRISGFFSINGKGYIIKKLCFLNKHAYSNLLTVLKKFILSLCYNL